MPPIAGLYSVPVMQRAWTGARLRSLEECIEIKIVAWACLPSCSITCVCRGSWE